MVLILPALDPILSSSKIEQRHSQTRHKHTVLPLPSAQPHLAQCCLWVGSGCWEPGVSRSAPDRWQHLRFSSSKSFKLWAKRVIWPRQRESFPFTCSSAASVGSQSHCHGEKDSPEQRLRIWCNQERGVNCARNLYPPASRVWLRGELRTHISYRLCILLLLCLQWCGQLWLNAFFFSAYLSIL